MQNGIPTKKTGGLSSFRLVLDDKHHLGVNLNIGREVSAWKNSVVVVGLKFQNVIFESLENWSVINLARTTHIWVGGNSHHQLGLDINKKKCYRSGVHG